MSIPEEPNNPTWASLHLHEEKPKTDREALNLIVEVLTRRPSAGLSINIEPDNPGEAIRKARTIANNRRIEMPDGPEAQQELLLYLVEVAQKTKGAEVWRSLFAEIIRRIEAQEEIRTL